MDLKDYTKLTINGVEYNKITCPDGSYWSGKPYKEVEYVQLPTGAYINTNCTVDGHTTFISTVQLEGSIGSSQQSQWGASTNNYFLFVATSTSEMIFYSGTSASKSVNVLQKHTYYMYQDAHRYGYDSSLSTSSNIQQVSVGVPIYLGARNQNGSANFLHTSRQYGSQIYWNGGSTLKRDLIPVKLVMDYKQDNKTYKKDTCGMWDKVEDKFYPNAGSGTITAGPDKN